MIKLKRTKKVKDPDYPLFLAKNLPVICVCGAPNVGKTTIARMLSKSSRYTLLNTSRLIKNEADSEKYGKTIVEHISKNKPVPDSVVVDILKEALLQTYNDTNGYIIDGFPINMHQAKLFERQICKISVIIYLILILDAILQRMITQFGAIDTEYVRLRHIKCTNDLENIYRVFKRKVIKINSNYPPQNTCTKLVENLEDFWGLKFLRLYIRN